LATFRNFSSSAVLKCERATPSCWLLYYGCALLDTASRPSNSQDFQFVGVNLKLSSNRLPLQIQTNR